MATSSAAIIKAAKDNDLRERFIALAAEQGIDNPHGFIDSKLQQLASAKVGAGEDTIASVYEYADAIYNQELSKLTTPGKNPAAVTDEHIRYALNVLRSE